MNAPESGVVPAPGVCRCRGAAADSRRAGVRGDGRGEAGEAECNADLSKAFAARGWAGGALWLAPPVLPKASRWTAPAGVAAMALPAPDEKDKAAAVGPAVGASIPHAASTSPSDTFTLGAPARSGWDAGNDVKRAVSNTALVCTSFPSFASSEKAHHMDASNARAPSKKMVACSVLCDALAITPAKYSPAAPPGTTAPSASAACRPAGEAPCNPDPCSSSSYASSRLFKAWRYEAR